MRLRLFLSSTFFKVILLVFLVSGVLYASKFVARVIEGELSAPLGVYHNVILRYSFSIPKKWTLVKDEKDHKVYLIGPMDRHDANLQKMMVDVTYPFTGQSKSDAVLGYLESLSVKCMSNYFLEEKTDTVVKGIEAMKTKFNCRINGLYAVVETYFVFKGEKVYIISFTVNDDSYKNTLPIFSAFVQNFSFE